MDLLAQEIAGGYPAIYISYAIFKFPFIMAPGATLQQYAWRCSTSDQNTKSPATVIHITLSAKIDTDA